MSNSCDIRKNVNRTVKDEFKVLQVLLEEAKTKHTEVDNADMYLGCTIGMAEGNREDRKERRERRYKRLLRHAIVDAPKRRRSPAVQRGLNPQL